MLKGLYLGDLSKSSSLKEYMRRCSKLYAEIVTEKTNHNKEVTWEQFYNLTLPVSFYDTDSV